MSKIQVKAISLWQPWASLVMLGAKQFETRSWGPNYTGPLVIHAAKKWDRENRYLGEPFKTVIKNAGITKRDHLHLGCALGVVELVDVFSTELVRETISKQERAFGDYSDGRFAWKLRNPRLFPKPIQVRGHQGFWYIEVDSEFMEASENVPDQRKTYFIQHRDG